MPFIKLTDDELLDLVRLNDDEAYQSLAAKYNRNSYFIAKKFQAQNPHSGISVDSLHSVAYLAFFTALNKYDGKGTFYPYWYTIAEHAIIDYIKENSYDYKASQYVGLSLDSVTGERDNLITGDVIGESDPVLARLGENEHYLARLQESGQQFREIEKDLIRLLVENYEIDEICDVLHITKKRLYSIIKSVKRKLGGLKNKH